MPARVRTPEQVAAAQSTLYGARKRAQPPKVHNLAAAVALCGGADLMHRGRKYHVPPVSYADGLRLERLLLQIAEGTEPPRKLEKRARRLIRRLVRPTGWLRRILWPLLPNPFRRTGPVLTVRLLQFLLAVPDEVKRTRSVPEDGGEPPEVDMLAGLAAFASAFPAWMRDGEPISWRHYHYGLAHLQRAHAGEALRVCDAVTMANAKPRDAEKWRRVMIQATK